MTRLRLAVTLGPPAISEAVQRGCHRAWARTEAGGPAEAFWRHLGWIGEHRLDGAYDEDRDLLQLRRELN